MRYVDARTKSNNYSVKDNGAKEGRIGLYTAYKPSVNPAISLNDRTKLGPRRRLSFALLWIILASNPDTRSPPNYCNCRIVLSEWYTGKKKKKTKMNIQLSKTVNGTIIRSNLCHDDIDPTSLSYLQISLTRTNACSIGSKTYRSCAISGIYRTNRAFTTRAIGISGWNWSEIRAYDRP